MAEGRIVSWWPERGGGYGFIAQDSGEPDIFVHTGDLEIRSCARYLSKGSRVAYEIGASDKGPKAVRVRLLDSPGAPAASPADLLRAELSRVAEEMVASVMAVARSCHWVD